MGKIGRPKQQIYDSNNNLIVGLSYDSAANTYFTSVKNEQGKWVKKNFGRNKEEAISKFRFWQEQQKGGKLTEFEKPDFLKSIPIEATIVFSDQANKWIESLGIDPVSVIKEARIEAVKIPDDYVYQKAYDLIVANPVLAAQKMKMPFLSDPDFIKQYKPKKCYTLAEIWDNYANRIKAPTVKDKHDTEVSWIKFENIIGVKTVAELNKEIIRKYSDTMYLEFMKDKKSTTWVKNHFDRVKKVINYAIVNLENISDLKDLKPAITATLKPPKASIICPPKKIPRELFHQILEASGTAEKAMWLLSINCAYYTEDVATLPVSTIDLENKTIIFERGKTGEHRASVLWQETVDAIKDYQKAYPHDCETLFQNQQSKTPYEANRIRKKFNDVLEKIGIRTVSKDKKVNPKNYRHSNFRDSFQSICVENQISEIAYKSVLGHKKGMTGKYIDPAVAPMISAPACQAVWEYYFGNGGNQ